MPDVREAKRLQTEMTIVTMGNRAIMNMWLRYIALRGPQKGNTFRRSGSHLLQLGRRPSPPDTPEGYWYERIEERLADQARKRVKPKSDYWCTPIMTS